MPSGARGWWFPLRWHTEYVEVVVSGLGVLLIVTFGLSGVGKLTSLRSSARMVHALRLQHWARRPRLVVTIAAIAELLLAIALVFTRGLLFVVVVIGAWLVSIGFTIAAVRAARLGSVDECGCFGTVLPSRVGVGLTRRNLVLFAVSSALLAASAVSLLSGDQPAVMRASTGTVEVAAVVVVALVWGMVLVDRPAANSPRVPGEVVAALDTGIEGAVLLGSDGDVVDPVQRALRGRAQLLLFVRPGCRSCDDVVMAVREAPSIAVDVRVVTAVGDGTVLPRGGETNASAHESRIYADPVGQVAQQLGVPLTRPAAALLTTSGQAFHPFAEGRDEVFQLIAAVASASESKKSIRPIEHPAEVSDRQHPAG